MAPTTAPVAVPTASGPAPVTFSEAHPSGAASAVLTAMRWHSAGISPSFCRARATASDAPRPTAPTNAAPATDLNPRCAASDAPARPPIDAAKPIEDLVATLVTLAGIRRRACTDIDFGTGRPKRAPTPSLRVSSRRNASFRRVRSDRRRREPAT